MDGRWVTNIIVQHTRQIPKGDKARGSLNTKRVTNYACIRGAKKKQKSRWAIDDEPKSALLKLLNFVREMTSEVVLDPEVQALSIKLSDINKQILDINKKFQVGQVLDNPGRGGTCHSCPSQFMIIARASGSTHASGGHGRS